MVYKETIKKVLTIAAYASFLSCNPVGSSTVDPAARNPDATNDNTVVQISCLMVGTQERDQDQVPFFPVLLPGIQDY